MDLSGMTLAPQGARKEALDAVAGLPQDLRELLAAHDGARQGRYGRIPLLAAGVHEFEGLGESLEDLLAALAAGR